MSQSHPSHARGSATIPILISLIVGLAIGAVGTYFWFAYRVAARQLSEPAAAAPQMPDMPSNVMVGYVKSQQVQLKRLITGQIQPVQSSSLSSEQPGLVIQAPPDAGSRVQADQVLVKLDTQLMESELSQATAALHASKANVEEVQAQLRLAQLQADRFKDLIGTAAASQLEYDEAVENLTRTQAALTSAQAAVEQSQARYDQIQLQLSKMTVKAPFSGFLTRKDTEVGQWLNVGSPIAALASIDTVDAILNVPQEMLPSLNINDPINLYIRPVDQHRQGKVFRVVPQADPNSRTFPVLIRFDNPDYIVKPGMSVEAELPVGQSEQALTVPRDAVQVTPSGDMVYVVHDKIAAPAPVVVRFTVDDRFVVDSDQLQPDATVVIEGNERLHPGASVNILNAPATPAENPQAPQANPSPASEQ